MRITIQTSDQSFYNDLKNQNIEGLTVQVVNKDAVGEAISLLPLVVNVSNLESISLFIHWLYDKLKDQPSHQTVINGHQINNPGTVNIYQITQVVKGKSKGKSNNKTSNKSKNR